MFWHADIVLYLRLVQLMLSCGNGSLTHVCEKVNFTIEIGMLHVINFSSYCHI